MPRYVVETATGRKLKIEAPDQASALREADAWDARRRRGAGETLLNATQTLNRAIPGFDEAADALQAGVDLIGGKAKSFPEAWAGARRRSGAGARDFTARRPVSAALVNGTGMAAQVLPAIVTGGGSAAPALGAGAKGLLGASARAFTGTTAKSALTGALGAYGATVAGEGSLGERLGDANQSIVPGAVVGALTPAAIKMGAGLINAGARRAAPAARQTAARAGRILAGRVPEIETAIKGAANDIRLPFERMGRGAKGLTRALANVPGPGQDMIENALTTRQALAPQRMLASTARDLGDDGAGYYRSLGDLDAARKSAAKPLYDEAYARPAPQSDDLDALRARPSIRSAYSRAARIAAEEGRDPAGLGFAFDDAGDVTHIKTPTMQTYDYVKRGLDDVLETYRDKTTGKLVLDEEGRAVLGTLNELRSRLTTMNPKYGEALDAYAGPTKQMSAMRRGRDVVTGRQDAEMVDDFMGRMSNDERDAMKLGMARGLSDKFRSGNPQKAFRDIARNPVTQDRMRAGFANPEAFNRFLADVEGEAGAQKSFNDILSGSRTTPLAEDIKSATIGAEDMGVGDHLAQAAARRVGGQTFRSQVGNAVLGGVERLRQPGIYDPEVNRLLSEVMVGRRGPQDVLSAMDELQAVQPMLNITPKAAAVGALTAEQPQRRRGLSIELEDGSGIDADGNYVPPRRH